MPANTKKLTPQAMTILRHFMSHATISASQATAVYGVARLAARVKELRDQGHGIEMTLVRGGAGKHYGVYHLKGTKVAQR